MGMDDKRNKKGVGVLKGQAAIERTSSAARSLKGQAAMEYLMTYGWAILVIVIVLGVLLYFLPQFLRAPESCIFGQAGFTCSDQRPSIYTDQGGAVHMTIKVFNGQGKVVNLKAVRCTTQPSNDVKFDSSFFADLGQTTSIAAGGTSTFDVPCHDSQGAYKSSAGSDFRGNFLLWYIYGDDVNPNVYRQAVATVSGPVLAQTAPQ